MQEWEKTTESNVFVPSHKQGHQAEQKSLTWAHHDYSPLHLWKKNFPKKLGEGNIKDGFSYPVMNDNSKKFKEITTFKIHRLLTLNYTNKIARNDPTLKFPGTSNW